MMSWFRLFEVWVLVWLAVGVGCTQAANGGEKPEKVEAVVIPLDQIWATQMPGTRNVDELDRSLVGEIRRVIGHSTPENQETKAAFAVLGTGADALLAAHAVFVGKVFAENIKRRQTFPEESTVSIVFFSAESGNYVHLDRVECQGSVVSIYYRFVPIESVKPPLPKQFALIPLGKLPPGKHRVNVIESPPEQKTMSSMWFPQSYADTLRIVGNSFSFFVGEQTAAVQGPNEAGGEIYLDEIWGYGMPETRRVAELDGNLVGEIGRSLAPGRRENRQTGDGFAVLGTGLNGLREAHAVLVMSNKPQNKFPADSEISLIFFTYWPPRYVHLHRVERKKNVIDVYYRFTPSAGGLSQHFALIPLGNLSAGEYRVNIVRSPMGQRRIDRDSLPVSEADSRRAVCNSFGFSMIGE
jgi:hypothetical protein